MTSQAVTIDARSATTTPPPGVREPLEVAKLIDLSQCIGCKACQVACMQWNDLRPEIGGNAGSYDNPFDLSDKVWTVMRFAEVEVTPGRLEWLIRKDGCMHCADPGCLLACPSPGAIVRQANGIVDFQQEFCIGCGYCVSGCPFDIPRLSPLDQKAYKCTLCSDRVAVGLEPACVKTCPTGALTFGALDRIGHYAETRVADLRERGFAQAGIYDTSGVGGTHVLYVLHHADQPELYSGLPGAPAISPLVELWKGLAKPLAIAGLAAVSLVSLFHYIAKGPNEVSRESEKEFES